MNILSLFDGMSCGMLALERAGIKVGRYYASEIDKYAQIVSNANYPNIIRVGDVTKWREWGINWFEIDIVIAGSPCQGFSFAGKQLAFDDPRSKLFFEFVDILKFVRLFNPNVKFLLENVKMKKDHLNTISEYMEVEPICINSALVSAQNRVRYYWTDIAKIEQPLNKGILLKDILIDGSNHIGGMREVLCNETENKGKSYTLTASYSGAVAWNSVERKQKTMVPVCESSKADPNVYNGVYYRKLTPLECERLQTVPDDYTAHVSNSQRYKMLGNGWTVDVIAHIFSYLK